MSKAELNTSLIHIKIYQAKLETPYKFFNYEIAQRDGFSEDHYKKVFDDWMEFNNSDSLLDVRIRDMIYAMFNSDEKRPSNYKGHSLSVSDVIVVRNKAYYCNDIGFTRIDWKDVDSVKDFYVQETFLSKLNDMVYKCDMDIEHYMGELKEVIEGKSNIPEGEGYIGTLIKNTAQRKSDILEVRNLYTSLLKNIPEEFKN